MLGHFDLSLPLLIEFEKSRHQILYSFSYLLCAFFSVWNIRIILPILNIHIKWFDLLLGTFS
jgi:hypothetical protein